MRRAPAPTRPDGPDPYGNPDPDWLKIDWRPHLGTLDLAGTHVNFVELGSGPPIVFVHGLAGCWQNWLENVSHFAAAGYRAIALDLPGFAGSPMPGQPISIQTYSEIIDRFCGAREVEAATLVGNSMGGYISAELASRRPAWLQRLALVSPAGILHARMSPAAALGIAASAGTAGRLSHRNLDASLSRRRMRQLAFGVVFRYPELLRRELLWEFLHHAVQARAFLPAVRAMVTYEGFLDKLRAIDVPTLIVWGRNDHVVFSYDAHDWERLVPRSTLSVYDRTGHVAMAERPVRFNRELQNFVEA